MIELSGIMGIPLLKKSRYTGSDGPLRFVLEKRSGQEEEDKLAAVFWMGELCFDATPREQMTEMLFPFTQEGLEAAQTWLNEQRKGGSDSDRTGSIETVD
ncbi:MAG: hypothetical protein HFG71_00995 [Hungatella sp.]|jgi:hypothetical protein|nr:hypothetical protein [Hungatella sp.]